MKNNGYYSRTIVVLCTAIWGWGGVSGVFASENSATVLPAEGNVVCADYAANSVILSMDSRSPDASGELTGPENPADADITGESVSYTITGGTTLSFSASTTPIDYAVIKSGRDVSVAMYPSGGVTSDGNLTVTVDGEAQLISAFSLCYGLGNEAPSAIITKSCDPDPENPDPNLPNLDATGIQCETDGSPALVCNFELDKPFFGTVDSDICCVCNSDALAECDPRAVAGDPNACTLPKGTIDHTLLPTEVTTHIELNNDPYYCITRAGRRFCYPY